MDYVGSGRVSVRWHNATFPVDDFSTLAAHKHIHFSPNCSCLVKRKMRNYHQYGHLNRFTLTISKRVEWRAPQPAREPIVLWQSKIDTMIRSHRPTFQVAFPSRWDANHSQSTVQRENQKQNRLSFIFS